ncbi:MAG: type 1 glutamine amidotransferase [Acidobacteria bacterium]|nr:type 1 glutamine amidotransferase [Acidobacteriota bacterium]
MRMRPLIGMTCRRDPSKKRLYLQEAYSRAISELGGDPCLIPLIDDRGYLERIAARVSGILLPGSSTDVSPLLYGQSAHPALRTVDPLRDRVDLWLLDCAFKLRLPVLAICYGVQILNVHQGGSLIQDLPSMVDSPYWHDPPGDGDQPVTHPLLLGSDPGPFAAVSAEQPEVNSSHHQALDEVASSLRILAWAPDGIVEAVQLQERDHFVLGVQWHPERDYQHNTLSRILFEQFVHFAGTSAPNPTC